MKNIFFLLLTVSLQSCNGQEKDKKQVQFQKPEIAKKETENSKESSINFLEKKYQINGFNIPDYPIHIRPIASQILSQEILQ